MKLDNRLGLGTFWVTALIVLFVAGSVGAYPTGPPPGVTGGFGEATCSQRGCHDSYELNAGKAKNLGDIVISDFPKQYEPGKTYPIKMMITHTSDDRMVWGFQLAARMKEAGTQAGELKPMDTNTQVVPEKGIQYIEHTMEGTFSNSFEFNWVAPGSSVGDVVLNAAGMAGNGDLSSTGDYIYATSVTIPPAK